MRTAAARRTQSLLSATVASSVLAIGACSRASGTPIQREDPPTYPSTAATTTENSANASGTGTAARDVANGGYARYVDAVCARKGDLMCIADAGMKFKDSMADARKGGVSLSKKLAACLRAGPPRGVGKAAWRGR